MASSNEEVYEDVVDDHGEISSSNPFLSTELEHALLQQKHENQLLADRERQLQEEFDDLLEMFQQQKNIIADLQVRCSYIFDCG